jgi:hypothetical protein
MISTHHGAVRRRLAGPGRALAALAALLLQPLPARAALSAPATSTGNYTVSWTDSTQFPLRAYLYERFNGGSATKLTVTGTGSRAFINKSAGTWGYQLEICHWEAELGREMCNPKSPEATVVVSTVPVPGTPSSLTATPAESTGAFSLTWSPVAGTVTYALEQRVSSTGSFVVIDSSATSPTALTRGDGFYGYRVRACLGTACGGYSNVATVTVLGPPGVPGSLGPNATTGTAYTVSWGASTGTVARYELDERVGTGSFHVVHSGTTRTKSFTDRDEAVYEYRVRACNDAGCSAYTASKLVTVAPAANIVGPATSTGVFTLSWSFPNALRDTPRLEERTGTGTWRKVFEEEGASSTTVHKVCSNCSHTYQYRLRFCDLEPELGQPICGQPGAVHRVKVTHPTDDVRASVPACTTAQRDAWTRARDSQGVAGSDGAGLIGLEAEEKELPPGFWVPNWFPVDGYKHTLCGRVHHFEVYDGLAAEMDFNHFILPDADHRYILDDVFTDGAHDCAPGQNNCVETEVTPAEELRDNPFFNQDGTSALAGRDACFYGPWVTEFLHGDRPEIHPSEQIWWRAEEVVLGVPTDVRRMAVVQDRSERFDRWAYAPRRALFSIPFEVGAADPTRVFTIAQEGTFVRNVVTGLDASAVWDADDGMTHGLVVGTRRVVEANETQSFDDDLGVRFLDVCEESGGRIRGMIRIRTHVGGNMTTNTGFNVLRVSTPAVGAALAGAPAPNEPEEAAPRGPAAVPVAVRRAIVEGRPALTMDVEVSGGGPLASATLRAGDARVPLGVGGRGAGGGELVRDVPVPLAEGAVLEWRAEDGSTREAALSGVALAPRIADARPSLDRETPAASAWAAVARAAGLPVTGAAPSGLAAVARWDFRLDTEYGTRRRGRVTEDDQSLVLEALGDALERRGAAALTLFGTETPLETAWSFAATELASGSAVPVAVGRAARPDEIAVEIAAGDSVRIRFPSSRPGAVYEIAATARTRDVNGVTGERVHVFWSVLLSDASPDVLAAYVFESLAGETKRSRETLRSLAADRPGVAGTAAETARRRARVLEQRTRLYTLDGSITVDELRTLARMARRLAE